MPMLSVTTELEAVNEMLMSIGQAPVNTLAVSGIKDVSIARARLTAMTRQVLSKGWNFNTDESYPLTPDSSGIILVPEGALKIEGQGPTDDYTQRRHSKGMALYNKTDRTFSFPAGVAVKVVWAFAFEDLPETARRYITIAAGRQFQSRAIGSQILDRFQEEDEMKAYLLLERDERGSRKTNLFRNNAGLAGFGSRSY